MTLLPKEGIMKVLYMSRERGWDVAECCVTLRNWAAEKRVTPEQKILVLDEIEAGIMKWLEENPDEAPSCLLALADAQTSADDALNAKLKAAGPDKDGGSSSAVASKRSSSTTKETAAAKKRRLAAEYEAQRQKELEEFQALAELDKKRAAEYAGLSLEQIKQKRLGEVTEEMDAAMMDIVKQVMTDLGTTMCSADKAALQGDITKRREAYMRLVHKRQEAVSVPEGLKAELLPYQLEGLEWMVSIYINGLHGILADEMGLGKTVQSISLLLYVQDVKNDRGPHLIVAPKSTLSHWQSEFKKFAPSMNVCLLVGEQNDRDTIAAELEQHRKANVPFVCITNYEQMHRNKSLEETHWGVVLVDEGHRLKNAKTRFHTTMADLKCKMRMLLTGTPLQNTLNEFWALLHYLLPDLFTCATDFTDFFVKPLKGLPGVQNEFDVHLEAADEGVLIERLHTMLAPFMLQRTKAQVMQNRLLPRVEHTIQVELSAWQQSAYTDLEKRTIRLLDKDDKVSAEQVNNALMQLRKIVLHPYLFEEAYRLNNGIVKASGKLEVLDRMLPKLLHFNHKVLIFSQFTTMLDILEAYMGWKGFKHVRLDGQVSHDERSRRIEQFKEDSQIKVFLLSSRAGGLGLNLQVADTVILFDLDWNPQNDKQAIARCHRIGQEKEVRVYRLITCSGVERHIERRCKEKLELENKIMGAGMFNKTATREQRSEMLKMILGVGEGAASAEELGVPTPTDELNHFLARGDAERQEFEKMDAKLLRPTKGSRADQSHLVRCGRLMRPDEVPKAFGSER
eukprot:gnl/MRDRNA2_/MRDRNA2_101364_c0_seq1.p1 gnl/MRDRNA2_/MRDRNA2_101364_c0~~gnl/MRDRNA2_/MRDRNA2_101364_c0_seq1.p1  ORF type:complete len:831 (+),score=203.70 gnl/MRDRNA2_/MRDRNA2_101364_c0_seq1:112-2493(+)